MRKLWHWTASLVDSLRARVARDVVGVVGGLVPAVVELLQVVGGPQVVGKLHKVLEFLSPDFPAMSQWAGEM